MTEQATDQLLVAAVHQRDVLMDAIHQTALNIGLCNKDVEPTGPQLLMFCDDFTQIINDQADKITTLELQLRNAGVFLND